MATAPMSVYNPPMSVYTPPASYSGSMASSSTTTPSVSSYGPGAFQSTPNKYNPNLPASSYYQPVMTNVSGDVLGATDVSGGGGGGGGGVGTGTNRTPTPESIDPLLAELDNLYSTAMSYAGGAEARVREAQPGIEAGISATAEQGLGQAETTKSRSEREVTSEKGSALTRFQNYMAQARQALQESGLGAKQRFGGASDISRALGEYANVGFQKAAGQGQQTYEQTVSKLNELWTQAQENYSGAVNQIKQWKTNSIAEAQRNFMNALNAIDERRQLAAENKSVQKLQLLAQYRDELNAIKMQTSQYEQQVSANNQAQASAIQQLLAQYGGQVTTGATGAGAANASAFAGMNPMAFQYGQQTAQQVGLPTGAVATRRQDELLA